MQRKTDITRNSVNLDRKEQGGGAAVEVGEGGLFRTQFLENLGMCFLGVTWGSRRSHGFYSTLQPAERLRNLEGVGGLDAAPRVRLSASWGREQNRGEKKEQK